MFQSLLEYALKEGDYNTVTGLISMFNSICHMYMYHQSLAPLLPQIATRLGVRSDAVKNVIIWGNHSSTQFPDVSHATVDIDGTAVPVYDAVKDDAWIQGDFIAVCLLPLTLV